MALPGSRDFDAVDSGPLPAATVNNIQDAIVGRAHGSIDKLVDIHISRSQNVTLSLNQEFYLFSGIAGSDRTRFVLPLRPGDRLLEWAAFIQDDAGPPIDRMEVGIFEADPATGWALTLIGALQISDGLGGDQKLGQDITGTPHVVLADKPVDLRFRPDPAGGLAPGNTMRIYPVMYLRWDHP